MKIETKEKLLKEYGRLNYPRETTAIKYRNQYKQVNINVFFDAFDDNNLSLTLVLSYDKNYYYTSLNINNTKTSKEYLVGIPENILGQILDENNMLDSFFNSIEEHIALNSSTPINYSNDLIFTNTLKYSNKSRKDLPFLSGTKKRRMTSKTLNMLSETMDIDKTILKKIQERGMTIVRTSDPTRRKQLTVILDGIIEI